VLTTPCSNGRLKLIEKSEADYSRELALDQTRDIEIKIFIQENAMRYSTDAIN